MLPSNVPKLGTAAMDELEKFNIAGPSALRTLLTTCNDPIEAIQQFQVNNSVQLPSLVPALKLLDLHEIPRFDYHEAVFADIRERMFERLNRLRSSTGGGGGSQGADSKMKTHEHLVAMLQNYFALIKIPLLQPILLEALQQLKEVPVDLLNKIAEDPDLYNEVATEVKQQIWQLSEGRFVEEVNRTITDYLETRLKPLRQLETASAVFFAGIGKSRRQCKEVQRLVTMVGSNVVLYDRLLQYIRAGYLESRNALYCSLRAEILMALHDLDVNKLINLDPCHKYAWCLDACLREKHLDPKHAAELKGVLDANQRCQQPILGDLSMISGEPHCLNFLAQLIIKVLGQCLMNENLPREHAALQLVLRLLNTGLHAWKMYTDGQYKEPQIGAEVYTRFLTALMCSMAKEQCLDYVDKCQSSEAGSLKEMVETGADVTLIGSTIKQFISTDPLCGYLYFFHVLDMCKKRQTKSLRFYIPLLCDCYEGMVFEELNLHLLVGALALLPESFWSDPEACSSVFEHLLLNCQKVEGKNQILKLCFFLCSRLLKPQMDAIVSRWKPGNDSPWFYCHTYESLVEKLKSPHLAALEETADASVTQVLSVSR